MSHLIPIDAALQDKRLLGAGLGDIESWSTWVAVLKGAFGLKLDRHERRAFAKVAGDRSPPKDKVAELWAVVGRRGGKSRAAAAVAVYVACFLDWKDRLASGEVGYVLTLSPSTSQAKLVFGYALAFLESSPILRKQIDSVTQSEIRLKNNITIAIHPASFRTVRGRTLVACVMDESAYWRDETSANPDLEVYRALLPALGTTDGMLVGISSPYRRSGLLFTRYRDHFGKDGDILVVKGATVAFNPTISKRVIDRARADDPQSARAEWDGEFRDDLSGLLTDALIDAAIDRVRPLELPRLRGTRYHAFVDASGGRHDSYTMTIGHREGDLKSGKFVADCVRGVKPPFDPQVVTRDMAALAQSFGISRVTGDNYSGEWVAGAFKDAGLTYEKADRPKSELYLEAVPVFSRHGVSIPDHPILIRELRLLERRVHRSGRDSVDHPQNGSDDYANSLVGCLQCTMKRGYDSSLSWVNG